jgi:Ca-activated chloride channel family protein
LFTDENPNVGDTSAEGFMAQAEAGSRSGVGLTTFGVGVHFDAELATHVSSVRGGNLFFVDDEGSAKQVFEREFHNMVNEVAHDIDLAFVPPPGFKITGVFGVPDDLLTSAPDGAIKVHISTAFLSSNGGGIFLTLGKDSQHTDLPAAALASGAPLLTGTLRYSDARTGKLADDKIVVVRPAAGPAPVALAKAQLLVDEFVTMRAALAGYHEKNDKKGAFHQLDGLSKRLAVSGIPGLAGERKLVDGLRDRAAYVAGYAGEMPKALNPLVNGKCSTAPG